MIGHCGQGVLQGCWFVFRHLAEMAKFCKVIAISNNFSIHHGWQITQPWNELQLREVCETMAQGIGA